MRLLSSSWVGLGLAGGLLALPAVAHKTEVSGNVAGIWHLEPNHSPKAGEPARIWVALSQQGGRVIPLEDCDCRLAIYRAGLATTDPMLEPGLEPVSAENYQGIPGADVTFPDIGEYRLVLTGKPQGDATFSPFELSYTTVVAVGRNRPSVTSGSAEQRATDEVASPENIAVMQTGDGSSQPAQWARKPLWLMGGVGIALIAGILGVLRLRKHQID